MTVSDILECFWTLFWSCSQEALFHCKIFGTNISLFLKSQSIPSTHYVQTSDFPWYLETSRKIKLKKVADFLKESESNLFISDMTALYF